MRRVVVEHPNGSQRVVAEFLPNDFQFAEHTVSRGNDVAPYIVRLKGIEKFARTGPQFNARVGRYKPHRFGHDQRWIYAGVRHPASKHRHH